MTDNEHNASAIEEYKNKVQRQAKRIAELEAENKKLEAELEMDAKKRRLLVNGYNKKCERVKEIEAENERLKAEREEANSWDDSWKMAEQITQLEKCLVNARNENAKLKCLVLHAMSYAVVSLTSNTNKFKPFRLFVKYNDAYRKAKADLNRTK